MTQWASWKQAIVSLAMLVSFSLFGQQNVQTPPEVVQARFIGNETCIDCHQVEVEAWQGSHHDMAMRHADSESVLVTSTIKPLNIRARQTVFIAKAMNIGSISKGQMDSGMITKSAIRLVGCHYNSTWWNLMMDAYN